MIPYGRQDVTQADIDAVVEVLRSSFLTQGPVIEHFESAVCARVGSNHAVAVNSATSALHIACLTLGLKNGDILWTVPNTFVASANCALYCGADVDFVDIDPSTWNMSVPHLEARLREAKKAGRLPKVLVPVHFGGQPTEQEEIWALAQQYGCKVIEDASHSIGASRQGEVVGSCRWSDITVFSFHPVKVITSGEGGIAVTNSIELGQRMRMFRSHGITRDAALFIASEVKAPAWHYEQQTLGYNYRMTDLHAALGLSQLQRLDTYVETRNQLATRYDSALRNLPLRLPAVLQGNRSAFHLYAIRVNAPRRRFVFEGLRAAGIGVNLHYMPVHLQPYYRALGFKPGTFPESEAHGAEAITLPLYPGLSLADQDRVVSTLTALLHD